MQLLNLEHLALHQFLLWQLGNYFLPSLLAADHILVFLHAHAHTRRSAICVLLASGPMRDLLSPRLRSGLHCVCDLTTATYLVLLLRLTQKVLRLIYYLMLAVRHWIVFVYVYVYVHALVTVVVYVHFEQLRFLVFAFVIH